MNEINTEDAILTPAMIEALVMATIRGNGGSATDAQIIRVTDWATEAILRNEVLELILMGALDVETPVDGEIKFAHRSAKSAPVV